MEKTQTEDKTKQAIARGIDLPISTRVSIEVCNAIRHKKVQRAKAILQDAINFKRAIPFKRIHSCGHQPGIGSGRFPINAATAILRLLESAEANAQFKGLSTKDLVITKVMPNEGAKQWHYGRHRRLKHKRTSIEIVLAEMTEKKEAKQETKKTENKQSKEDKK